MRICRKNNNKKNLYIKLKQDCVGNISLSVCMNEIEFISYNFEGCHTDLRKLMIHEIPNSNLIQVKATFSALVS